MVSKIFTVDEAAEFLKVSPGYVQELMKNGELKFYRIGVRAIRISQEHIEEYLKRRENKRLYES